MGEPIMAMENTWRGSSGDISPAAADSGAGADE